MSTPIAVPAVDRYLRELELALKGKCGVVPEDVLSDTRDFLLAHLESQSADPPARGDRKQEDREQEVDALYQQFVESFGSPERVAAEWERTEGTPRSRRSGIAPGWRICCTRCGRSAPADKVGITRIGARSTHKYVVGWCKGCRRLRWMRLQRDLDRTNLSEHIGQGLTGEQYRQRAHRPWRVALWVMALTGVLVALPWLIRFLLA